MTPTPLKAAISLLLITTIYPTPARAAPTAEDLLQMQMQMSQMSQARQQQQRLQDSQIVRPSPRERDTITRLLSTKPRPKTLNDADIKYLKDLLDKATWFGFERRIMHEIWTEVSGKEWTDSEMPQSNKGETLP